MGTCSTTTFIDVYSLSCQDHEDAIPYKGTGLSRGAQTEVSLKRSGLIEFAEGAYRLKGKALPPGGLEFQLWDAGVGDFAVFPKANHEFFIPARRRLLYREVHCTHIDPEHLQHAKALLELEFPTRQASITAEAGPSGSTSSRKRKRSEASHSEVRRVAAGPSARVVHDLTQTDTFVWPGDSGVIVISDDE